VAAQLLSEAARTAKANGLGRITTIVQCKNDPAVQLLTNCGYEYRGFIDRHFGNGDAGLLYSAYL
jgi:ribosomal protein S18 acetylase RimI-like enzyme